MIIFKFYLKDLTKIKHIIYPLLLICLSTSISFAQLKPETEMTPDEEELYENNLDHFEAGNYNISLEGFSQLLSLFPREPVFNFYYGASMVKLHNDIKKGIEYLEFAADRNIGEANFYIGLGYHFLYDFNNALRYYENFKNTVKEKHWSKYEIDKFITQSKNGKELLRYAYELHVINNRQIASKNFYYSYDLDNFGGEIIVKTERFKGKADKKINTSDLMYISDINNVVLLSSYGDSKKNSLDIYISHKTTNGWSDPNLLSENINTPYDEAYPFLTEDGTTLYFSSKGHNSIGGYDIFRSYYNSKDNTWSIPENLDFPINTPFDEIMFCSDRFKETAYFASDRESKSDRIGVYRILLERDPETRQLASMEDIYQHASLEISPGALAELTKRENIRANSMIDSSIVRDDNALETDTADTSRDLINDSYNLLSSKKSDADEFMEYAAAAYQICELEIGKIEKLNKKIGNLRNKSDDESIILRDSLNKLLTTKSMLATEMYDLSQHFYKTGTQTKSLTKYYNNELGLLDNITGSNVTLKAKSEKLYNEIQNINTSDPLSKYSSDIINEINLKKETLKLYQSQLDSQLETLNEFNRKIEVKLDLARNEPDIDIREKYIYDVKTYENNKIDLISEIKASEVQVEFLNYEIEQLKLREKLISDNYNSLEESLFTNPELDISKLNNSVDLLKTHISQNSLRELSEKQGVILSDNKYYSQEIDLDAILYAGPDITDIGLDEIMIDTKEYTEKYAKILSENTLKTGELVFKNDSLKDHIAYLETEFDNAGSQAEKQLIITQINDLTSEITENNNQITDYLNSQPRVDISIYVSEFEDLKNSQRIDLSNPEVKSAENLITESFNLNTDIEDLKILGSNEEIPPILYLEGMKSEIDNLIISKIETLKTNAIIVVNNNSDIFENLENELQNVNHDDNNDKLTEITNNYKEIEKLYRDANRERDIDKKNELLVDANRKLDLILDNNINMLNDQLVQEYQVFNIYHNAFKISENQTEYTTEYLNKIIDLESEASNLQMQAEETSDDITRMQILSKAWNKLNLANQYYNYVLEVSQDQSKYDADYEIKSTRTIDNYLAITSDIQRIEPEIENTNNNIAEITDTIQRDTSNIDIADNNIENLISDSTINEIADNNIENIIEDSTIYEIINIDIENNITDTIVNDIAENNIENIIKDSTINEVINIDIENNITDTIVNDIADINSENIITDTSNNLITDNNNEIIFVDTSNNISNENNLITDNNSIENTDTTTISIQENNVNEIANNIVVDSTTNNFSEINDSTNISDNNSNIDTNENTFSEANIDKTIEKLNDVNYQGRVSINISSQSQEKTEIDELSEDINNIKDQIAETTNKTKIKKLNTDLQLKEEDHIDAIIKYSITTNEIITELDTISKFSNNYNLELIQDLRNKQSELRSSIIDYSNFYSADEIMEKHLAAANIESELLDLYNSLIQSTDQDILANNLTRPDTNSETNISIENTDHTESELNISDNYKYEYPYDKNTESDLSKLEIEIDLLESNLKVSEKLMNDIESEMNTLNDLKEYKKLQKQLEKENKKYLKQLKSWAELNKDLITLQYDFGDEHYYNAKDKNSEVSIVSDSLMSVSEDCISETIALFEVIITYQAKLADESIKEAYQKAANLSAQGINTLNTANSLKSEGNANDPIILAHYRTIETNNESNNNDTTVVQDSTLISSNDIIIDTLPVDTIPEIDSTLTANENENTHETETTDELSETNSDSNNEIITESNISENTETETNAIDFRSSNTSNVFDPNLGSFYSDENQIPEIPQIEGLFYRIQIAAFNGKVANNRFNGMKPIYWEAIPNSALVRYIVGDFKKINKARTDIPLVQNMGYQDAFIVAYHNGVRISIYEAKLIEEREYTETTEVLITDNTNNENFTDTNVNNEVEEIITNNNTTEITNINNEIEDNTSANETSDITQTNGIFFCVQIGVYATELGSDRLFGLLPIMYHNYTGKLIRHIFGRYYDFNTAVNEQNKIRRLGIPDAFIVAYNNGEKITINEARKLLENTQVNEDQILVNIPDDEIPAIIPIANNEPAENNITDNIPKENQIEENELNPPTVEFYIQIGVFRNDVNTYVRESFSRIAGENKLILLSREQMTLYRIGIFNSYQDAQNSLGGVKNAGIKDAFIVAFVNGKRVSIEQARSLE